MSNLNSLNAINSFIKENKFVMIYFSSDECNVCKDVSPILESMLKKYPIVVSGEVEVQTLPSVASGFSVFTAPTIIIFFEEKEIVRQARYINFLELEEKIQRLYEFI